MFDAKDITNKALLRAEMIKNERFIKRKRLRFAVIAATSLALIIGLSLVSKNIMPQETVKAGAVGATLLAGGNFGGYVLIGVVGFVAGAAVSIIALKKSKKD